jgi:protoporphyrinogen oxidase
MNHPSTDPRAEPPGAEKPEFGDRSRSVVVMGGGPAGLTAAYELCKAGIPCTVLEKDSLVGGLARTTAFKGYRFDIGGHRFFTKVKAVDDLWREILPPAEFRRRKRLSRIYYGGRYFAYPLRIWSTLKNLGVGKSLLILASYARSKMFPIPEEKNVEQWVSNRFGRRLYRMFFQTYTEKVWGIPCKEISADWAAQRIQGLSLATAIRNALGKAGRSVLGKASRGGGPVVKTLIDEFDYPNLGPGMMWERATQIVTAKGVPVRRNARVTRILREGGLVTAVEVEAGATRERVAGTHFISTLPIGELIEMLDPPAPPEVRAAAAKLHYRDFLTVALIVKRANIFPDNWLYIHEPAVRLGRIQNYKNWSEDMVPDPTRTCLGLEYFCFEHDDLWDSSDASLIALATSELVLLGLIRAEEVEDGTVVRVPKAYPIYDDTLAESLLVVRRFLEDLPNLQLVGRNGTHHYNNQDHSMLGAMLAVKNLLGERHDLWSVNVDASYHEEMGPGDRSDAELAKLQNTQPRVPRRVREA